MGSKLSFLQQRLARPKEALEKCRQLSLGGLGGGVAGWGGWGGVEWGGEWGGGVSGGGVGLGGVGGGVPESWALLDPFCGKPLRKGECGLDIYGTSSEFATKTTGLTRLQVLRHSVSLNWLHRAHVLFRDINRKLHVVGVPNLKHTHALQAELECRCGVLESHIQSG